MRKLALAAALLAVASVSSGCKGAYPSTEDRIENIEETIQKHHLSGVQNPDREKRFQENVK
jgi:hypothetical protein